MIIKHATEQDIRDALHATQTQFNQNLEFRENTPEHKSSHSFRVRLGVKSSHGKGASIKTRYNFDGFVGERHLPSACWHVHGRFFEHLFHVCPVAIVYARGTLITATEGNWQDYNVGSAMFPVMASESCDCE